MLRVLGTRDISSDVWYSDKNSNSYQIWRLEAIPVFGSKSCRTSVAPVRTVWMRACAWNMKRPVGWHEHATECYRRGARHVMYCRSGSHEVVGVLIYTISSRGVFSIPCRTELGPTQAVWKCVATQLIDAQECDILTLRLSIEKGLTQQLLEAARITQCLPVSTGEHDFPIVHVPAAQLQTTFGPFYCYRHGSART